MGSWLPASTLVLLTLLVSIRGDFEPSLSHCCSLGTKWGAENLKCAAFPAPVVGIPNEQQTICLSAVHICCLRKHRDRQCDLGKQSARADRECSVTRELGGESHKDCCEGCKLGLVAGSMSMSCSFRAFQFGAPWDEAYATCCKQALQPQAPQTIPTALPQPRLNTDEDEDLCARFPGELCAHVCVPTPGSSYRCECREGFELLADGKSCQQTAQLDRCAHNNPCDQKCTDTGLAVECSCHFGYELANDQRTCIDIDECALGVDTCDLLLEVCTNQAGGYLCAERSTDAATNSSIANLGRSTDDNRCPKGFKFNAESRVCDDIDECSVRPSPCELPLVCQNTIGSFSCVQKPIQDCPLGFRFSQQILNCVDIDECIEQPDICPRNRPVCVNVQGSYTCQLTRDETSALGPTVTCPAGYKFNNALQTCEDVDECAEKLDSCLTGFETCINVLGLYYCEPLSPNSGDVDSNGDSNHLESIDDSLCPSGYSYDEDEKVCIDLDECLNAALEEKPVCEVGVERCVNTEGSYRCVAACPTGYQAFDDDADHCVDIDECLSDIHTCTLAEKCVNTEGSYTCETLRPAIQTLSFLSTPITVIYPTTTTTTSTNVAITTPKPETTTVKPTTTPKPTTSTAKPTTTRKPKTTTSKPTASTPKTPKTTLRTIKTTPKPTLTTQSVARLMTTESECQPGFHKTTVNGQCKDINECEEGSHKCRPVDEDCVNTVGSYRCKPLTPCPSGFQRDQTSGRCSDIDECTERTDNCPSTSLCVNTYGAFNCRPLPTCSPGHRFNVATRYCQDIDECAEGLHNCSRQTQSCVNGIGDFRCVDREPDCGFGFRYDPNIRRCADINECAEGKDYCNVETEVCVNDQGGYRCTPKTPEAPRTTTPPTTTRSSRIPCPRGYRFNDDSRRCMDINECVEANPCRSSQQCENTVGSYVCRCGIGFRFNAATQNCEDVNECLLDLHDCVTTQRCDNTIGSYTCVRTTSCGTGYTFNAETVMCEDDDECLMDTHDCHRLGPQWQCRNTEGSYRCERKRCESGQVLNENGECLNIECAPGFEPDPRGRCNDIDECARNDPCPRAHRCINTVGSFQCTSILKCDSGFGPNESATECVDIDECSSGTHDCRQNQICQNRPGGFTCLCPQGYTVGADRQCQDIDECTRFAGQICSSSATCVNTPGSYRCQCKDGFRSGTDSRSCVDIDECSETARLCQHTCANTWGSFVCSCRTGYTLAADGRSCQDVDECEQYRERGGLCVGICVNEPGSYSCKCPEGYRLNADNRTCQDIDECATPNVCRSEETCLNTRGGYYCNAVVCPPNYVRDQDHRNRCKRVSLECHSWDAECLRKPVSYSYNFLTLPSKMAIPRSGHLDLFSMRGPLWPTASVQFALELDEARAGPGINPVTRNYFTLRRSAHNQAVLALARSIPGPQDIELQLNMEMFQNGVFSGVAVVKIYIYVTRYEF